MTRALRLLPAVPAASLLLLALLNLCALYFQCGCQSWFTGAAAHCNIHDSASRHCPWCVMDQRLFWSTTALIVAAQFLTAWRTKQPPRALLYACLTGLLLSALFAAISGLASGYWR